jgi:hypothetical protein
LVEQETVGDEGQMSAWTVTAKKVRRRLLVRRFDLRFSPLPLQACGPGANFLTCPRPPDITSHQKNVVKKCQGKKDEKNADSPPLRIT